MVRFPFRFREQDVTVVADARLREGWPTVQINIFDAEGNEVKTVLTRVELIAICREASRHAT